MLKNMAIFYGTYSSPTHIMDDMKNVIPFWYHMQKLNYAGLPEPVN